MKELTAAKKLTDIMPFNEVYYKDCFYNCLFSIVKYFQGEVMRFFLNDIILYRHSPYCWLQADVDYVLIQPVTRLLNDMSIELVECKEYGNIVYGIREALSNGMPVIVKVDCFYEPMRPDLFGTEHLDHNLLVYGYDDSMQTFNIFEHKNKNSLRYKPETISYACIQEASDGYYRHFGHLKEPAYIKFCKSACREEKNKHPLEAYVSRYAARYLENRAEVIKSMEHLLSMKNNLVDTMQNRELLEQHADEILESLMEIIAAKKLEQYRINSFFKNKELEDTIQDIVNGWTFVRLSILSYKYSGEYIDEKLSNAISVMEKLCGDERKMIDLLIDSSYKAMA